VLQPIVFHWLVAALAFIMSCYPDPNKDLIITVRPLSFAPLMVPG